MTKHKQIAYLLEAALLIRQILPECDPDYADDLQDMAQQLDGIAKELEKAE